VTIDERLERLVERHEALTQTVEHLALQGEAQNKRIDKITELISDLALIARDHERRIKDLE
jgi:hypothetical protein